MGQNKSPDKNLSNLLLADQTHNSAVEIPTTQSARNLSFIFNEQSSPVKMNTITEHKKIIMQI